MSATNRGAARVAADYYPTPLWVTRHLLRHVTLSRGLWLEPCAGEGHIIRAADEPGQNQIDGWHALELREDCRYRLLGTGAAVQIGDARQLRDIIPLHTTYAVAVTNPPFSIWPDIVRAMHSVANQTVVLLRMGACIKQDALLADLGMPDVYVLPDRPSFTGKGSDATEYAWHRWTKEKRVSGEFRVLPRVPLALRKADTAG